MKKTISAALIFCLTAVLCLGLASCALPGQSGGKPIKILYCADFKLPYADYTENDVPREDVASVVGELSGGTVKADDVEQYVSAGGKYYEITLPSAEDPARAAREAAETYLATLTDMTLFAEGAPVRYRTVDGEDLDVLLIAGGDQEDGKATVKIYVFLFTPGSAQTVSQLVGTRVDPGGHGDPGGNEGGGGTEEGGGGQGGAGVTTVRAWNINASGEKELYQSVEIRENEPIDVWNFGDGWRMYTDEGGKKPADEEDDFRAKGKTLDLYRRDKDNKDFIGVTFIRYYTDRYGKDGYFDRYTQIYRKGAVADIYSDVCSYYGGDGVALYKDRDKKDLLDPQKRYAFSENVTLYAFCTNNSVVSYDIYGDGGGLILTQALGYVSLGTSDEEFHSETVHIRGSVAEQSLPETARSFRVKDVKHSKLYSVAYCYNGHVVKTDVWYFEDRFAWAVNQNGLFYTDPGLTANTSYAGDGEGIHYFTGNVTLYQPLEASGFYCGD